VPLRVLLLFAGLLTALSLALPAASAPTAPVEVRLEAWVGQTRVFLCDYTHGSNCGSHYIRGGTTENLRYSVGGTDHNITCTSTPWNFLPWPNGSYNYTANQQDVLWTVDCSGDVGGAVKYVHLTSDPPGPIPELHVGPITCTEYWRTDCGEIHTGTNTDMYYTYYGYYTGGVTCTEAPWGHAPNVHFPYDGSNAHWTVSCRDALGRGFNKTWHVMLPQPPGPVVELHIGSWVCHDWYPSDCGTVAAAPGTDMYYTYYGNYHGGVVCSEKPWGHAPGQHFPFPGWPPGSMAQTWYVLCIDSFDDAFDKQVRIVRP
jgi:hypothetical protein